jgi:hypothetical protein
LFGPAKASLAAVDADRFYALHSFDTRHDDVLWEFWINGFETAIRLRPQSWAEFADGDEDTDPPPLKWSGLMYAFWH